MADLVRVSILGSMPGGEVWSVNPVFAFSTGIALSTDELAAMAVAVNGASVPVDLRATNVPAVAITGCRIEARKKTGELEAVAEAARPTPIQGSATAAHPFQTSIVASLRTADSSARGKGRLYWPATGVNISNTTLRLGSIDTSNFITAFNIYLAQVRTAVRSVGGATTAVLAVWSRTNNDTRVVLSMRAGDVADVQRRRRDSLTETYATATVAAL